MKCEMLAAETFSNEFAYVLPNSVTYVSYDTGRNAWRLHLTSGDTLYYTGSLVDFVQWLQRSYRGLKGD